MKRFSIFILILVVLALTANPLSARIIRVPDDQETIQAGIQAASDGDVVIVCGGGGIPVVERNGELHGIEGVIDKDLASERLAEELGIKTMMILTDVDNVYLNYGKSNKRKLKKVMLKELKKYQREGHFPKGSMGPKMEASIRFLENRGERVFITSPKLATKCLQGKAGTALIR